MRTDILSESAEAAISQLSVTHASARDAPPRGNDGGRFLQFATPLGVVDPRQAHLQAAHVRSITTVEAFCDAIAARILADRYDAADRRLAAILSEHESRSARTWDGRRTAFADVHRVPLTQVDGYKELMLGVEVRNAVAHRLGHVTLLQRRRLRSLVPELSKIDIALAGDLFVLGPAALDHSYRYCRAFVENLDRSMRDAATT